MGNGKVGEKLRHILPPAFTDELEKEVVVLTGVSALTKKHHSGRNEMPPSSEKVT